MGGKVEDICLVTTPQLQYIVVCLNTKGAYGQPTLAGYYDKLSPAFNKFMSLVPDKGQYSPWCSMEPMVWGPCPWLSSNPCYPAAWV